MLFSTSHLHAFARLQLGDLAHTACLPFELLDQYATVYPEGLVVASTENTLHGFFLLVPLTDLQAQQLLYGQIKNGFELANCQTKDRPTDFWHNVHAYYLMGIYADEQGKPLIKAKFEAFLSSFQSKTMVFAKGTTDQGKGWMKKRGFQPVLDPHSPLSFLHSIPVSKI